MADLDLRLKVHRSLPQGFPGDVKIPPTPPAPRPASRARPPLIQQPLQVLIRPIREADEVDDDAEYIVLGFEHQHRQASLPDFPMPAVPGVRPKAEGLELVLFGAAGRGAAEFVPYDSWSLGCGGWPRNLTGCRAVQFTPLPLQLLQHFS